MPNVKSFYIKVGRLRVYSGNATPYYFDIPFRGTVTAPIDRARPAENLVLDRGNLTLAAHYSEGSDEQIMAALAFSCQFRLTNTEPNYSKLISIIRAGSSPKLIANRSWQTAKGTSQIKSGDPEGAQLVTTPGFADDQKFCVNLELLWADSDGTNDRGFQWKEVYFPTDRQITEGEGDVMIDLSGEIYGAINTITTFSAGNEG